MEAPVRQAAGFFQDPEHYVHLTRTLAPALARRRSSLAQKHLRGWSAGHGGGEEAYSLAMALLETPQLSGWTVNILATGVDAGELSRAGRGEYASLEGLPPRLAGAYFMKVEAAGRSGYRVGQAARRMIQFRRFNPASGPFPFRGGLGFIFCKDVMIYLDEEAQNALVERFYGALEPGGALYVGRWESLTGLDHRFAYAGPGIYQKPEGAAASGPAAK